MENVVYFLGAGFSAPLGLPVMSDFLQKAKDLYFSDPEKHKEFLDIIGNINDLHVIKTYLNSDLRNIEEILSILVMQDLLNNTDNLALFRKFISEVINNYTKKIEPLNQTIPSNWYDIIIKPYEWRPYGYFVASCFNLIIKIDNNEIFIFIDNNSMYKYSLITLNYDMVIENVLNHFRLISRNAISGSGIDSADSGIIIKPERLAKLHGSANSPDTIIPPTWNKSLYDMTEIWKYAWKSLIKATHLIFMGYSLPDSDAYVRYLIKSAIVKAPNLRKIDAICIDREDQVEKRYRQFIEFRDFRFKRADIFKYLQNCESMQKKAFSNISIKGNNNYTYDKLLEAHNQFMDS